MKEIGGYLELEMLINNPYHNNMIELNTGRNALVYLVKAKQIRKLYVPFFICDSVTSILKKHSIEFERYHIDENFRPLFDHSLQDSEFLYIVNYYGQLSQEDISYYYQKHQAIIMDNTQAFFQKPYGDVDTIYSCRKFFGVPDGAYLFTNSSIAENLEIDQSGGRMSHILGRYEGLASDYYNDFVVADAKLADLSLKQMSKLTKNLMGAIDYEKIKDLRTQNFNYLYGKLNNSNKLDIRITSGAFAYPYYCENGLEVRKKLAMKKIYIPLLWPNVLNENSEHSTEYKLAANILPLPCDQRYGIEEMQIIIEEVSRIGGNI